jgi:hypothetical protein
MDGNAQDYPTKIYTVVSVLAPSPPDGRCITDLNILPSFKLSFSFLIKAFEYEKYQYLREKSWTQQMTETYLRSCCVGGDLIKDLTT